MNKKGFTLIEIMAVIVVLAMLILIAIPLVSKYMTESKKRVFAENAQRAISTVDDYNLKQKFLNKTITDECDEDVCYYNLDQINQLLEKKFDVSPFGAKYDKENSKLLSVEMNSEGKTTYVYFMCLIDKDNNGFSYKRQNDINRDQVQIGSVNNCGNAFEYILTADANKGRFSNDTVLEGWTFNNQYATTSVTYKKTFGALPTPIREGYSFAGWYTQKDGGVQITENTVLSELSTTTIYAHWNLGSYTVTVNATGGTISNTDGWTISNSDETLATKQVSYGNEYGPLPVPTRDGYVFQGWYTDQTGGSVVTSSTPVSQDSDHTIYARWGCIGMPNNSYVVGDTVEYAGLNWTVISNTNNNVSLALNNVSGTGSYNNATTNLTNSFIDTNTTLKVAKEQGCLVNQGTSSAPAYVTSNSGSSAANKPGYEHWISSGSVYLPNQINRYTTSNGVYVKGYRVSCEFLVRTAYATSISSSVLYSAGSTYSASNSNSSITFASASYTTSKTAVVADVISTFYLDKDECKSPNSKKLAISRDVESNLTISGGGTVGDTNKYCGTKVVKAIVCGGSYDGNTASFTARDSTTFSHVNANGASDSKSYYSNYNWWEYAGTAHSTTTGTAGSNLVRTFNFRTDSHCGERTIYSVGNLTKDIYYRPFIKVYKK